MSQHLYEAEKMKEALIIPKHIRHLKESHTCKRKKAAYYTINTEKLQHQL